MPAFDLPPIVEKVRAVLPPEAGLYLVGGAVRDLLLRRRIHDLDFVLPGDGRPLARALADRLGGAYYPLDDVRGVGRVVLSEEGRRLTLDFAQLRGASLSDDLAARDFTINAMALDLSDPDLVIDPLGGQADLRAKVIRACGETALADDPVRTVRAVRFAAHLGFRLDPSTRSAVREAGQQLRLVAAERRRDELVRCLSGPRASATLRSLHALGLMAHLVPEAESMGSEAWEHTLGTVARLDDLLSVLQPVHDVDAASDLTLGLVSLRLGRHREALAAHLSAVVSDERPARWLLMFAALLHRLPVERAAASAAVRHIAGELRLSVDEGRRAADIVSASVAFEGLTATEPTKVNLPRREVFRYFQEFDAAGVEGALLALAGYLAQLAGPAPAEPWNLRLNVAADLLRAYLESPEVAVRPVPLVTGDDLMTELGLPAGPRLGRLLKRVYEAQAAGEVTDRAGALAYVRSEIDHG